MSSSSDLEQPASFSSTRLAAPGTGMLSGREHEQLAPSSDAPKIARFIAPQPSPPSRIMVDIRGANLAKNYKVYICQEPQRNIDIATAWSGLQALGGLCITLLTIQKLWEDVRFIRILRSELSKLSTLAGSLTDDDGNAVRPASVATPRHRRQPPQAYVFEPVATRWYWRCRAAASTPRRQSAINPTQAQLPYSSPSMVSCLLPNQPC